jgi:hypothetical protein
MQQDKGERIRGDSKYLDLGFIRLRARSLRRP